MKTNQKPEMVLYYPEEQVFIKATMWLKELLPSFPLDLPSPLVAFLIGKRKDIQRASTTVTDCT